MLCLLFWYSRFLFGVTVIAKICQIQLSRAQCSVLVDKAMGLTRWVLRFLTGFSAPKGLYMLILGWQRRTPHCGEGWRPHLGGRHKPWTFWTQSHKGTKKVGCFSKPDLTFNMFQRLSLMCIRVSPISFPGSTKRSLPMEVFLRVTSPSLPCRNWVTKKIFLSREFMKNICSFWSWWL